MNKERPQSEEATARRRMMIVDSFFTRASAAVAVRNRNASNEQEVVRRMEEAGARVTLDVDAQAGIGEGEYRLSVGFREDHQRREEILP